MDDSKLIQKDTTLKIFNTESFIVLQPTDWTYSSFVIDSDGIVTALRSSHETRLSSNAAAKPIDITSIRKTEIEESILKIVSNPNVNSQLVYGLFPATTLDINTHTQKPSGNLDPVVQMNRIIEANKEISKKTQKPSILLLPQDIALETVFRRSLTEKNIHFIDFRITTVDLSRFGTGDVIIVYTGSLQQAVFDHLMLQGTTLPAVIEGCNSRESCEYSGKPFIHGSMKIPGLKQYEVALQDQQELHKAASACLETGDPTFLPQLVEYMESSLNPDSDLHLYHKQRQAAFMARPDACENALDTLGIKYREPHQDLSSTCRLNV